MTRRTDHPPARRARAAALAVATAWVLGSVAPSQASTVLQPTAAAGVLPAVRPLNLIGAVDASPVRVVRQDQVSCGVLSCPTGLPAAAFRAAGGAAFDSIRGGVWISNGLAIACYAGESRGGLPACRTLCPPQTIQVPGGVPIGITGLAVNEHRGVLVVTDAANTIHQLRLTCPLGQPISSCTPLLPRDLTIGGVATDDANDRIIFSASTFSRTTAVENRIYMVRRSNPCALLCPPVRVTSCAGAPLGPITGVAYDSCQGEVWVTDGGSALCLTVGAGPCLTLTPARCCTPPSGRSNFIGLCMQPHSAAPNGPNCTSAPCASCSAMVHETRGEPTLGNPQFALRLTGAPRGAPAVLILGVGACQPPGIFIPGFCNTLRVPLFVAPVVVNLVTRTGASRCSGSITVPAALPNNTALCGAVLSSQFGGFCVGGGGTVGTFLSNCLTLRLGGG